MKNEMTLKIGLEHDAEKTDQTFSDIIKIVKTESEEWEEILGSGWQFLSKESDKAWRSMADGSIKSVGDALGQTMVLGIKGGLDQAGPVWEKAWNSLMLIPEKSLGSLLSNLGTKLLDFLAGTFSDKLLAPILDGLGIKAGLESLFKSNTSTVGSWLGIAHAGSTGAGAATTRAAAALLSAARLPAEYTALVA